MMFRFRHISESVEFDELHDLMRTLSSLTTILVFKSNLGIKFVRRVTVNFRI